MLSPYINFKGKTKEALNLYEKAFNTKNNGVLTLPEKQDWVIHASVDIVGIELMLSDSMDDKMIEGDNITLSVKVDNDDEVRRIWDVFIESGSTVITDLNVTFFSSLVGVLKDPFNINWMIMVKSHQND